MTLILWTLCFLAGIGFFLWQLYGRFGAILKVRRDDHRNYQQEHWGLRLKNTLIYAFGQKKFFRDDQPAGVLHVIIFWGFVTLGVQVLTMFTRGWVPEFRLLGFGIGGLGAGYALLKDIFQALVFVAVSIAFVRWTVVRPTRLYGFLPAEARLRGQHHWEALVILGFIATIMVSGFFYDAVRIVSKSWVPDVIYEQHWQPISSALSAFFLGKPELAANVEAISWWTHNLVILVFLNLLPRSKHFHIITAIPNVFLGKIEPKGKLAKSDFTVDNPLFGRSTADQFTWKQALDMYSCPRRGDPGGDRSQAEGT